MFMLAIILVFMFIPAIVIYDDARDKMKLPFKEGAMKLSLEIIFVLVLFLLPLWLEPLSEVKEWMYDPELVSREYSDLCVAIMFSSYVVAIAFVVLTYIRIIFEFLYSSLIKKEYLNVYEYRLYRDNALYAIFSIENDAVRNRKELKKSNASEHWEIRKCVFKTNIIKENQHE